MLFHSNFYFENQIWLIKRYARKSIYHGCMVWIEKSVTRDHCSASLGKPRDVDHDPRDRFFYPHHAPMKDTYMVQSLVRGLSTVQGDEHALSHL